MGKLSMDAEQLKIFKPGNEVLSRNIKNFKTYLKYLTGNQRETVNDLEIE